MADTAAKKLWDNPPVPTKLLWIDLEMTGLDPDKGRIIEVATIVTDFDFKELDSYQAVVKQEQSLLNGMDEWNKTTHASTKLLEEIPNGIGETEAEQALLQLIEKHFSEPAVLAGNSIHFDRRFIRRYWPKLEAKLHYRMLDVTAFKVLMQGKFDHVFTGKDVHRAMDDVKESIAELKDYLEFLSKSS